MIISVARSKDNISEELKTETKQSIGKIRFGVTISKRVAKQAVVRNRVKRLLREAVRQIIKEQYFEERFDFDEIVFVWKINPIKASMIRLEEVKTNVEYLFKKIVSEKKESNTAK